MLPKPPEPEESLHQLWLVVNEFMSGSFWNGVGGALAIVALVVSLMPKVKPHTPSESWSTEALVIFALWMRMVVETLVRVAALGIVALVVMAATEWCWHAITGEYANASAAKIIDGIEITKYQNTRHVPLVIVSLFVAASMLLLPAAAITRYSHCRACREDNLVWLAWLAGIGVFVRGSISVRWLNLTDPHFIRVQLMLPGSAPSWLAITLGIVLALVSVVALGGVTWWYLKLATSLYGLDKAPVEAPK